MKAAVLHQPGTIPTYDDLPDPVPAADQTVLTVTAAAIKRLDLSRAAGTHYTSYPSFPTAVGVDGVGRLDDGRRVYSLGLTGMMAEKALIPTDRWVPLPDGLDDAVAAALPNALLGADAALLHRARLQPGETVWINGATGATGTIAVQTAKMRGAGHVVALGRNAEVLARLKRLGADETISLAGEEPAIQEQLQAAAPPDVVVDYLWGRPIEWILHALQKTAASRRVRVVTVGEMAGAAAQLPSGLFRSSKIELLGSGIGALTWAEVLGYFQTDMPAMLERAAAGELELSVEQVRLADVEAAWARAGTAPRRIVLLP